jgi:hypothetical protein
MSRGGKLAPEVNRYSLALTPAQDVHESPRDQQDYHANIYAIELCSSRTSGPFNLVLFTSCRLIRAHVGDNSLILMVQQLQRNSRRALRPIRKVWPNPVRRQLYEGEYAKADDIIVKFVRELPTILKAPHSLSLRMSWMPSRPVIS